MLRIKDVLLIYLGENCYFSAEINVFIIFVSGECDVGFYSIIDFVSRNMYHDYEIKK